MITIYDNKCRFFTKCFTMAFKFCTMAVAKNRFTLNEVLKALESPIPSDGEDSDIASKFSESDTEVLEATDAPLQDEEPDAFDDLHAVDVIESDDEEETSSRSGRLASFDFSNRVVR